MPLTSVYKSLRRDRVLGILLQAKHQKHLLLLLSQGIRSCLRELLLQRILYRKDPADVEAILFEARKKIYYTWNFDFDFRFL
ncbi:hypothetical protein CDL12_19094 [Handroanthus impetiginosus]|uniref:Uncharacterized protein n=1 Tax=Handroanthus impetiginosus TaxID=429701 RepID=A0A2G9GSY3_9LAMI|nr:hypothetical protein CDL12_19094 [Handroanthus impetiginosus]